MREFTRNISEPWRVSAPERPLIAVNAEGDNSIIVIPGANDRVDRDYVDSVMDVILTSDIVILQLEIPFDTVCYVAEKAKEAGKCVILDPAPARELPEELIRGLTIVKPNQTEIMKVLGRADEACQPERELNTLKAMGVAHPDHYPRLKGLLYPGCRGKAGECVCGEGISS